MSEPETRSELYASASPEAIQDYVDGLTQDELDEWPYDFRNDAHAGQEQPNHDWRTWLVMGGRGFGKTRAGAEWVRWIAESNPSARIALIGASLGEARSVMVEGESGLIACSPPHLRPRFEPSLHRLRWPNGAQAFLYSAAEPESLRGPQHSHACRAKFCGPGCTLSAEDFSSDARLASFDLEQNAVTLSGIDPAPYLYGELRWFDGPHAGTRMQIIDISLSGLVLDMPISSRLVAGIGVRLKQGCDHTLATCQSRFGNAINFQGEPFLPGNDLLARYPLPE